ncbi:helix-turn-helix domain-containing protein [Clostridium nigeriense]|uniref:helix-turn-helix domain-containing protein n=1 Tax=Clostridium nigeriense TaxID=1805470 RepID=UPI00083328DA|nr:helix-turn-helix transcriptional regulator [Clostridium nigeriense]
MVGSKIAEIRNKRGISLSKLSRESGVSKGYLSELENGIKENPNIEILDKIAKALGISVSDLFEQDPIDEELEDLEEDMKLLFSKAKQLSKENRKKVLKMIEIFEDENNN